MIYILEEHNSNKEGRDIFSNIMINSGFDYNNFRFVNELSGDIDITDIIVITGEVKLKSLTGKSNLNNWRGSVLDYNDIIVYPTYGPSRLEYEYGIYPTVANDLSRLYQIWSGKYTAPIFDFNYTSVSLFDIESYLQSNLLSVDIESVKGTSIILCVGFAISRERAISLDFKNAEHRNWIKLLLESDIPKLFHNGNFDVTMLELNGLTVNNYKHDTMLMQHIIAPELPRKLSYITSIYTPINYYKSEGKDEDDTKGWSVKRSMNDLMGYNCKDVCATYWCYEEMYDVIYNNDDYKRIYEHEIKLAIVTIEMGHNGLLLDIERNDLLRSILVKKEEKSEFIIKSLVGFDLVIRSSKQVPWLLYEHFKLPKRSKYDKKTKESKLTSDNDALISLISFIKTQMDKVKTDGSVYNNWKVKLLVVNNLIILRGIKKLISSYIDIQTHNGRIKSTYKPAGTESGRLATGNFVDGSGINLATLPRESIE